MSSQNQDTSPCLGPSLPLTCSDADTCSCRRGKSTCTCCLACPEVHSDIVTHSASSVQGDASLAVAVASVASTGPFDLQLSPGVHCLQPCSQLVPFRGSPSFRRSHRLKSAKVFRGPQGNITETIVVPASSPSLLCASCPAARLVPPLDSAWLFAEELTNIHCPFLEAVSVKGSSDVKACSRAASYR